MFRVEESCRARVQAGNRFTKLRAMELSEERSMEASCKGNMELGVDDGIVDNHNNTNNNNEVGIIRRRRRRRRLHIVYFLSRNGKTEQPHLITVDHHLFPNTALHLRDVKKWICDLRGKEMADSFAWSYKRKYKGGYIWEDLTDDDIIAPISDDHQYVIKGSLLPTPSKSTADSGFLTEEEEEEEEEKRKSMASTSASKKPHHETLSDEENAVSSSFAEREIIRRAAVFKLDAWRAEKMRAEEQQRCMEIVAKKKEKGSENNNENIVDNGSRKWASDVLKNLFKCKTVETKDSVTTAMRSNHGGGGGGGGGITSESNTKSHALRKKCETSSSKGRAASAMYKPASEPSCSQCGRPFRPEKMNVHMNSCKALKERGRS
ncbi:hypothetical protein KSP40_PGU014070 [Platanthera guangdongensis]|uniref:SOSEKI DIX-like domain-containing protein n=1 Tax=Platanthera guangdongensis TaxID=2320717 RepID=A0ABR2MET2_9ASPA